MRDGRTADGQPAQKREKISKNRESGSPSSVPLARSLLSVRPSVRGRGGKSISIGELDCVRPSTRRPLPLGKL